MAAMLAADLPVGGFRHRHTRLRTQVAGLIGMSLLLASCGATDASVSTRVLSPTKSGPIESIKAVATAPWAKSYRLLVSTDVRKFHLPTQLLGAEEVTFKSGFKAVVVAWETVLASGVGYPESVAVFAESNPSHPPLEYLVRTLRDKQPKGMSAAVTPRQPPNADFGNYLAIKPWMSYSPESRTLSVCTMAPTGPLTYLAAMTPTDFKFNFIWERGSFHLVDYQTTGSRNGC